MTGTTFTTVAGPSALLAAVMAVVGMVALLRRCTRGGAWGGIDDATSVVRWRPLIPEGGLHALVLSGSLPVPGGDA